jgi:hypothetical protein
MPKRVNRAVREESVSSNGEENKGKRRRGRMPKEVDENSESLAGSGEEDEDTEENDDDLFLEMALLGNQKGQEYEFSEEDLKALGIEKATRATLQDIPKVEDLMKSILEKAKKTSRDELSASNARVTANMMAVCDAFAESSATTANEDTITRNLSTYVHMLKVLSSAGFAWDDPKLEKGPVPVFALGVMILIVGTKKDEPVRGISSLPRPQGLGQSVSTMVGLGQSVSTMLLYRDVCSYMNRAMGHALKGKGVYNTARDPRISNLIEKLKRQQQRRVLSAASATRREVVDAFDRMDYWKNPGLALQSKLMYLVSKDLMLRAVEARSICIESIRYAKDTKFIEYDPGIKLPSHVQLEVQLAKGSSAATTTMTLYALPDDPQLCPILTLTLYLRMRGGRDEKAVSGPLFCNPCLSNRDVGDQENIFYEMIPIEYRTWNRIYKAMFTGILSEDGARCTAHGPRRTGAMTWLRYHGTTNTVFYGRWKQLSTACRYSMNQQVFKGFAPKLSTQKVQGERDFEIPPGAIFFCLNNHS